MARCCRQPARFISKSLSRSQSRSAFSMIRIVSLTMNFVPFISDYIPLAADWETIAEMSTSVLDTITPFTISCNRGNHRLIFLHRCSEFTPPIGRSLCCLAYCHCDLFSDSGVVEVVLRVTGAPAVDMIFEQDQPDVPNVACAFIEQAFEPDHVHHSLRRRWRVETRLADRQEVARLRSAPDTIRQEGC